MRGLRRATRQAHGGVCGRKCTTRSNSTSMLTNSAKMAVAPHLAGLEMSYKNSQNIVPSCAIVPNIDRQS